MLCTVFPRSSNSKPGRHRHLIEESYGYEGRVSKVTRGYIVGMMDESIAKGTYKTLTKNKDINQAAALHIVLMGPC